MQEFKILLPIPSKIPTLLPPPKVPFGGSPFLKSNTFHLFWRFSLWQVTLPRREEYKKRFQWIFLCFRLFLICLLPLKSTHPLKSNTFHLFWRFSLWQVTFPRMGEYKKRFQWKCCFLWCFTHISMKITSSRGLKVVEEAFYANAKLDSEILICSTSWNFTEGELCEHARMRLVF